MDKSEAVQKMQDYIKLHIEDQDFQVDQVCADAGYSRRNADRLFGELLGLSIQEYVRAIQLTNCAWQLRSTRKTVLEMAMENCYSSHEGFTRAFQRRFFVNPSEYRRKAVPIPLFIPYPVSQRRAMTEYMEENKMNEQSKEEMKVCMVTAVERPARKFIYLPSKKADGYWSYCQEMGCEWEGLLNSIPEKFDTASLAELPKALIPEGCCRFAAGVEVPADYEAKLPEGYLTARLEAGTMLYFQSEPYEDEKDFCKAIDSVFKAVEKYNFAAWGYQLADSKAPSFNYGAENATGAKVAVPVIELNKQK